MIPKGFQVRYSGQYRSGYLPLAWVEHHEGIAHPKIAKVVYLLLNPFVSCTMPKSSIVQDDSSNHIE